MIFSILRGQCCAEGTGEGKERAGTPAFLRPPYGACILRHGTSIFLPRPLGLPPDALFAGRLREAAWETLAEPQTRPFREPCAVVHVSYQDPIDNKVMNNTGTRPHR